MAFRLSSQIPVLAVALCYVAQPPGVEYRPPSLPRYQTAVGGGQLHRPDRQGLPSRAQPCPSIEKDHGGKVVEYQGVGFAARQGRAALPPPRGRKNTKGPSEGEQRSRQPMLPAPLGPRGDRALPVPNHCGSHWGDLFSCYPNPPNKGNGRNGTKEEKKKKEETEEIQSRVGPARPPRH